MNNGVNSALISGRYAEAFYELYKERITHDNFKTMVQVVAYFKKNPSLISLLKVPIIANEIKKQSMIDFLITHNKLPDCFERLIDLLIKTNRLYLIAQIMYEIEKKYKHEHKLINIEVKSSCSLTADQQEAIIHFVARVSGKKPTAHFVEDPSLIAGVRIVNDTFVWECSVKKQLAAIQRCLD